MKFGRIVKVIDTQSKMLDIPTRKIILVFDEDGINKLDKLDLSDRLHEIGYTESVIRKHKKSQTQFKLVVFDIDVNDLDFYQMIYPKLLEQPISDMQVDIIKLDVLSPKYATWENVIYLSKLMYPAVAHKLYYSFVTLLKQIRLSKIDIDNNFKFIDSIGSTHKDFIDYERFQQLTNSRSLYYMRAFFYFELHLKELFKGDGYIYKQDGTKGMREYIMPNFKLTEQHKIVDLGVL